MRSFRGLPQESEKPISVETALPEETTGTMEQDAGLLIPEASETKDLLYDA